METQTLDVERRLRRIERTIPYLSRMNAGCLPGSGVPDCGGGDLRAIFREENSRLGGMLSAISSQ